MDPDALLRLLRERRSVRRTTGEPVSRELLERLIDAGRYAPTGTNAQNLGWIVFETPESVLALRERVVRFYAKLFRMARHAPGRLGLRLMAGEAALRTLVDYLPAAEEVERRLARGEDRLTHHAPAFMLVHGPAEDPCSPFNGAVALYHASLLAHTLGLGCCFNGFVQNAVNHDRALATEIGIPDGNVCVGAMGLGHADPRLRYRRLPERRVPPVLWR
jgi:nitroreductase